MHTNWLTYLLLRNTVFLTNISHNPSRIHVFFTCMSKHYTGLTCLLLRNTMFLIDISHNQSRIHAQTHIQAPYNIQTCIQTAISNPFLALLWFLIISQEFMYGFLAYLSAILAYKQRLTIRFCNCGGFLST